MTIPSRVLLWIALLSCPVSAQEVPAPVPERPAARRVMARAMVHRAVACRGQLEVAGGEDSALRAFLLTWIESAGVASELEPDEVLLLRTEVGRLDRGAMANATWRTESLAVLAWALGRCELPPYDTVADEGEVARRCFPDLDADRTRALLDGAALRPAEEIDRLAAHLTIVRWRLQDHALSRAPMEFASYLRSHPGFRPYWLDGLFLVDGDLAFQGEPLPRLDPERRREFERLVFERQEAACWLQQGGAWSEVVAGTVLVGR